MRILTRATIVAVAALCLFGCATYNPSIRTTQGWIYGSTIADTATTLYAVNGGCDCAEANPIFGTMPEEHEAAFALVQVALAYAVDWVTHKAHENREHGWWWGAAIYSGVKAGAALHNGYVISRSK